MDRQAVQRLHSKYTIVLALIIRKEAYHLLYGHWTIYSIHYNFKVILFSSTL